MCSLNYPFVALIITWCMNSTMVQLEPNSNVYCCFLGIAKNSNNGFNDSYIPTSNDLVVTNEGPWQIEQLFFFFFPYHPICQLCTNILLVERSKHFLVLGMLSNFGVLYLALVSHQTLYSSQFFYDLHAYKKSPTQEQTIYPSFLLQYKYHF